MEHSKAFQNIEILVLHRFMSFQKDLSTFKSPLLMAAVRAETFIKFHSPMGYLISLLLSKLHPQKIK